MIRQRLLLLCLGLVVAAPAAAQIMGRPIEASGQAGFHHYDVRARMQDGPGFGGSLGWRAKPWLVLEGQVLFGSSNADRLQHDNQTNEEIPHDGNPLLADDKRVWTKLTSYDTTTNLRQKMDSRRSVPEGWPAKCVPSPSNNRKRLSPFA